MKKVYLQFLIFTLFFFPVIGIGQNIVFVGFNADADGFAFLVLETISNGMQIDFSDGEGTIRWTANSDITPGTVVKLTNTNAVSPATPTVSPSSAGSAVIQDPGFDLDPNGDSVTADLVSPPQELAAIASQANDQDLNNYPTANTVTFTGNLDVLVYTGATTCGNPTDCATAITNPNNWDSANGNGDESADVGTSGYDAQITILSSGFTALPIVLVSFEGQREASSIHLSWRTATEQNNDYMAVERSADGAKFEELGRVKGAGTTQEPQAYTFTDYAPRRGLNYYRLRQVDYDGAFEYHQVISVLFDSKETGLGIQAFPNPVQDQLQARWAAAPGLPTTLRVLDMVGRQLATYEAAAGVSTFEVPLNVLPAGLYFLQVSQGQETGVLRFRKE